jgi:uncharacterized coiled-coil DUF342 family protein
MADQDELQPLTRLEERIVETVSQLRAARQAKTQAEQEAASLRERVTTLESERRQILERVENLLGQIDSLAQG